MTCITDTRSKRHLSAKLALGLAISALLVFGTFVTSANAADRRDNRGGGGHQVYRGGGRGNWNRGGYYPAPPVVYGTPYYYPPPVAYAYGPGININVPGISIGIQ